MEPSKSEKLQAEGWTIGDVVTFLDLSREEVNTSK